MSKTNKLVLGVIILILVIAGIWWGSTSKREAVNIKVGAILPLSGSTAYYGNQAQRGIEIAKNEIKSEYPNIDLEVFYEDSQYIPKNGVDAYQSLRNLRQVDAIIPLASHVAMAIQSLSNKDGVIEMAIASTADKYSTPDDYSFRTIPSVGVQVGMIVEFLQEQKYNKVSILTVNNDFGKGAKEALKSQSVGKFIIANDQDFLGDAADFRTQLLKIKEAKSEAAFIVGTAANYANILNQAKEIGLNTQFISISSTEDPVLIKNAASTAEGMIYTYYNIDPKNKAASDFINAFKEKYGESPEGYAAEAYEALRLIASSYDKCGKNSQCAKNYLENLKGYSSVFGKLGFNQNGDVSYNFIFKTIKNGQFAPYEK